MREPYELLPERVRRRIDRAADSRHEKGRLFLEFSESLSAPAHGLAMKLLVQQALDDGVPDDEEAIVALFMDDDRRPAEEVQRLWREEIRPRLEQHPGRPTLLRFVVPNFILDFAVFALWCSMDNEERRRLAEDLSEE